MKPFTATIRRNGRETTRDFDTKLGRDTWLDLARGTSLTSWHASDPPGDKPVPYVNSAGETIDGRTMNLIEHSDRHKRLFPRATAPALRPVRKK